MSPKAPDAPLWTPAPARVEAARLSDFARRAGQEGYPSLHRWSVEEPEAFWSLVWEHCGAIGERGATALQGGDCMPGARWFPDARLSFAENLLRRDDDRPVVIARGEDGSRRELSGAELRDAVGRLGAALAAAGVEAGDRIAGWLPNGPEALIAMLATAELGAVWSSCSPDFGTAGLVDRFGQIEPRVLFACEAYDYGGRRIDCLGRLPETLAALPSVRRCVVVPHPASEGLSLTDLALTGPALTGIEVESWDAFLAPSGDLAFERRPFDQPLYVLYSSGTTGKPKCIVHGAGGTLLQHLKEHRLQVDLGVDDRLFYFTTCGWMMWNWLVSALASEATIVLYDGSPFHPGPDALWRLAEEEGVTVFGTSAKYLDAVAKGGQQPGASHDLSRLRSLLSTGSPLSPEGFDFVYERVASDLHLASISGGTDIISCFVGGDPTGPVFRGEIQRPGLGMKVEVWNDDGERVLDEPGELVCTAPFPSMPVGFHDDPGDARYRAAYFERFPGVWCHGDWIRETPHGGYVITGRSDAVLNPGGVRIGTSEIYRVVEGLDEVREAIAVGQSWRDDVRVLLFVVLREGLVLDDALRDRIRAAVRSQASPRHVPAKILAVPDIPRTRSGKITELAVREVVHDRPVKNVEALANPEALEHFRDRAELQE